MGTGNVISATDGKCAASGQHRNLEMLRGRKPGMARSNPLFWKVSKHVLEMLVRDTGTCCSVLIGLTKRSDPDCIVSSLEIWPADISNCLSPH